MQDDYEPTGQADYRQGRAFSDDIADDDRATPLTPAAEQWDGWGTALKPSIELICLARKPLSEKSVAANVLRWGTGALNIDECRVSADGERGFLRPASYGGKHQGWDRPWMRDEASLAARAERNAEVARKAESLGRFPANLCHDGSDEVMEAFPSDRPGCSSASEARCEGTILGGSRTQGAIYSDSGSAARFFYSAKAGPLDRLGSIHPTVKPVDLMRWLCRLVCPPGGLIIDPFAGSGSTGIAAIAEGMRAELIDIEADHVADIERKLALLRGEGRHLMVELNEAKAKRAKPRKGDAGLFDEELEAAE
jgi:site-specific DNA-methyltransferase (adenine-specific)